MLIIFAFLTSPYCYRRLIIERHLFDFLHRLILGYTQNFLIKVPFSLFGLGRFRKIEMRILSFNDSGNAVDMIPHGSPSKLGILGYILWFFLYYGDRRLIIETPSL